jgi:serine/threonine-protein kinase
MALKPGDTLHGQYRILRLLGRGGFGSVYHGRDTLLDRDVAVKELVPALVHDPAWVKRFLVEARATLDLHHPNIIATHTLFAEAGNHYLVME